MINTETGALDPFDVEVGRRIGEAVLIKGTTLLAVSDSTGISYATLRRSVKGQRSLNMQQFGKIAKVLDIKPATLIPEAA